MAEKYTKGDGSQTANGDIPVVAPINMGLGLKYKSATKRYDVSFGADQPFKFNSKGDIEFKISEDKGNLIRQGSDNGIYYGIEAKANVANLYVDAENGVDQNPNDVPGAGTREKPLRTLKYAADLADNYTVRTIWLHEEQEHIVNAKNPIGLKPGSIAIYPYGSKISKLNDGSRPDIPDGYQARMVAVKERIAPSIVFKGVRDRLFPQATAPQRWNVYEFASLVVNNDVSLTISGVNLVNDVNATLTNTHPTLQSYNLVSSFERITTHSGSVYLDGVSFARRGSITVVGSDDKPLHLAQADEKNLWLTGMVRLLGSSRNSLLVRNVFNSDPYDEYIVTHYGWGVSVSTLNSLSISGTDTSWSSKRIYGVKKEVQPSGDVLVLSPIVDVPNQLFA